MYSVRLSAPQINKDLYLLICGPHHRAPFFRLPLTKLRLSSHIFSIERGRWGRNKVPLMERKCILCDVLEDEYHYLVECPMFKECRKACLPEQLRQNASMYEFIKFVKSEKLEDCRMLGLLCMKVMKEHRKYISSV